MKTQVALLTLALAAAGMAGCSSTPTADEGSGAQVVDRETSTSTSGASSSSLSPFEDPSNPLSKRVFYFDFDKSDLSPSDRDTIGAHAHYLSQNPATVVTVEGHADERGTREYNLALGERRAKSVENLLQLQGAGRDQVDVVSYGEERPASECHDESCWSLNRRAEIKYPGR